MPDRYYQWVANCLLLSTQRSNSSTFTKMRPSGAFRQMRPCGQVPFLTLWRTASSLYPVISASRQISTHRLGLLILLHECAGRARFEAVVGNFTSADMVSPTPVSENLVGRTWAYARHGWIFSCALAFKACWSFGKGEFITAQEIDAIFVRSTFAVVFLNPRSRAINASNICGINIAASTGSP